MEFSFSDNISVDNIEKVPQDFRPLYVKKDDKYVLDQEDPKVKASVSAVTGLNQALKAARAEAKAKQPVDLSPLSSYGTDPAGIKAKIDEELNTLKEQLKSTTPNVEKIRESFARENAANVAKSEARADNLKKQLHRQMVVATATQAIAEAKGDADLLMPFVNSAIKTVEDAVTGEVKVQVVDAGGDVRYSGVTGQPLSIKELVAEMKMTDKYGKLFASETPRGGGTAPGTTRKPTTNNGRQVAENANPISKIAAGISKGQYERSNK